MATEVVSVVRSDGLGDYTTLAAWIAAEQRDLIAADEIAVAECAGTVAVNYINISTAWNCDETRYVEIRPLAGEEYDPVADTGFKIAQSGQYGFVMRSSVHIRIIGPFKCYDDGIMIRGSAAGIINNSSGGTGRTYVRDGFFYGTVLGNGVSTSRSLAENCRISDLVNTSTWYLAQTYTLKNVTTISGQISGPYSGQIIIRSCDCTNCVIYNETVGGYDNFYACTGDYNASNDTSAPGANSIDNITTAAFNDYAGGDYSLASGSILIDAGADSGVTVDILGVARVLPYDIGAFEFVRGGGPPPIELAGALAGSATVSASLTAAIRLAAQIAGSSTLDGSLSIPVALLGTITGGSSTEGDLLVPKILTGTLVGSSAVNATLTHNILISASVNGTSTAVGTMQVDGSELAAAVSGDSTALASLTTQIQLAAGISGTSTITGLLLLGDEAFPDLDGIITIETQTPVITAVSNTPTITLVSGTPVITVQ